MGLGGKWEHRLEHIVLQIAGVGGAQVGTQVRRSWYWGGVGKRWEAGKRRFDNLVPSKTQKLSDDLKWE